MAVYRERQRAIFKATVAEYGIDNACYAYTVIKRHQEKCLICHGVVTRYSEWNETGYEVEECANGCWGHETHGSMSCIETKGFYFEGKLTTEALVDFEKQIKKNAKEAARKRKLFWKKKKSQRKQIRRKK